MTGQIQLSQCGAQIGAAVGATLRILTKLWAKLIKKQQFSASYRANRSEARWKPLQTFRNTPENHSKPCGHLCGGGRVHRQTATAAPCEHHLARGNSQTGEKKVTANPSWAFCLAVRLASQLSRRWTKINNFWFSGKQRCSAFQRAKNYWFWLSDEKVVTSWKKVLI